jgi:acyl-CoA thioesterase-1
MKAIIPRFTIWWGLRMAQVAVISFVVACGGPRITEPVAAPRPTLSPVPAAVRVVFLGDSLSAGLGLAEADAFPSLVRDLLREAGHEVDVVNAGVSGDTSTGGLSRVDWVLRQEPHILVVELGGNDALRGQPLENTENNLRLIVRRGLESGARVVLLGMDLPTNYGPDYAGSFADMYERIAREERVLLVPEFVREVGSDPAMMQPDGLHPTAEGHRLLAESLVPYLGPMVEELTR